MDYYVRFHNLFTGETTPRLVPKSIWSTYSESERYSEGYSPEAQTAGVVLDLGAPPITYESLDIPAIVATGAGVLTSRPIDSPYLTQVIISTAAIVDDTPLGAVSRSTIAGILLDRGFPEDQIYSATYEQLRYFMDISDYPGFNYGSVFSGISEIFSTIGQTLQTIPISFYAPTVVPSDSDAAAAHQPPGTIPLIATPDVPYIFGAAGETVTETADTIIEGGVEIIKDVIDVVAAPAAAIGQYAILGLGLLAVIMIMK